MLVYAAITEFKLHVFSLGQITLGFCNLCRTGSPVYHVVLNQVFSRFLEENLGCPCIKGLSENLKKLPPLLRIYNRPSSLQELLSELIDASDSCKYGKPRMYDSMLM